MKVAEINCKESYIYFINGRWEQYSPSFDDKAVAMIDHRSGKIWISEVFWR